MERVERLHWLSWSARRKLSQGGDLPRSNEVSRKAAAAEAAIRSLLGAIRLAGATSAEHLVSHVRCGIPRLQCLGGSSMAGTPDPDPLLVVSAGTTRLARVQQRRIVKRGSPGLKGASMRSPRRICLFSIGIALTATFAAHAHRGSGGRARQHRTRVQRSACSTVVLDSRQLPNDGYCEAMPRSAPARHLGSGITLGSLASNEWRERAHASIPGGVSHLRQGR